MIEKRRIPALAFFLSLFLPGLGHFYSGRPMVGLRWWLTIIGLLILGKCLLLGWFWGLIAMLIAAVSLQLFIAGSAWRHAKSAGTIEMRWYQRLLVYVFVYVGFVLFTSFVVFPSINLFTRYNAYRIPSGLLNDN